MILKKMKHVEDVINLKSPEIFQYNKENYQNTFKPMKTTVKEHFTPKHIIYDKFNNNLD